ncbi:hypothetical protein BSBH6_03191 [Bacillus subtilis]|nr:hypothetical protein BSBH6_03191 [Bacillus subtilis]RPK23129.1 hypothetical protein BH5_03197 [Bacillus subtilis]
MYDVTKWKHVFKLDPNKDLPDEQLEILCESGTDAVIIGGSDGVTEDNVLRMMSKVRRFLVPCVLEVSAIEAIVPGFDLYFIPSVLNSKNADWIVGMHQKAMKEYGELMSMEEIVAEGYCIANPDCKAASLTEAEADLSIGDIVAYARVSELLHLPIFYLEYSGVLGDIEAVKKTKAVLETSTLFYGGGIKDAETAKQYAEHADVIVVGNAVYEDFDRALKTVAAVKGE